MAKQDVTRKWLYFQLDAQLYHKVFIAKNPFEVPNPELPHRVLVELPSEVDLLVNEMSGLSYAQILAKGNSGGSGGESSGGAAEDGAFRSSRTLPRNFGNSSRESGSGSGQGTICTTSTCQCQMLSFVIPHPGCLKPGGGHAT